MTTATETTKIEALRAKLSGLSAEAFALVTVPAVDVMGANVEMARLLERKGFSGIYVTLAKDYLSVTDMLTVAGVDVRHVRFVDAVSRMYGIAPVESEEVVYVDGPLSVTAIIDGITASLKGLEGDKRYVLLDSLTTIMLYNSLDATLEFGKSLRSLLRKEGVMGVVVIAYSDAMNKDLLARLKKGGGEIVAV